MSLLGIDVGTSGCKAAAFSEDGRQLGSAYREYATIHQQPGWAELDSRAVLDAVWETVAEVAAETARDPITALCVSTMGEAMTPVSADRVVLDHCILSSDPRGGEHAEALAEQIGQEALYEINPNLLGPNYSLPKLLWLRENRPELYNRADKFLLWGDLVAFMLGCDPVTSFSHANRTLLFDIRRQVWSDRLLDWSGIDRRKLPVPVASGTVAGQVGAAAAKRLGLPKGVTVVVGGHDQCCNALGAGISRPGRAVCGIGTFQCIVPVYDHIPPAATMLARGLNVEHHVLDGLYVSFLYNQAGSLVRWFRDTFASADRKPFGEDEDVYDVLTAEMPAEPTRLLVLPYFEVTGAPHFVADASGVIAGLRTGTTRGEILKAVMESTTFYFVESVRALREIGIDTSEFIATGGGAKSDAWLQIQADILGTPFTRLTRTECGIAGAAMLAGMATGVYTSSDEAVERFVARERTFQPSPSRHETYRARYQLYRQLYPRLADFLPKL